MLLTQSWGRWPCCGHRSTTSDLRSNGLLVIDVILLYFKGATSRLLYLEKFSFSFSSSSFVIRVSLLHLVPLWIAAFSLVFIYFSKLLFSGFLQFKANFACGQTNSKCCDWDPSTTLLLLSKISVVSWWVVNFFLVVTPLTRKFCEKGDILPNHCEQNGCQSDELVFHILSWTSTPKLRAIWDTTKVGVKFNPSINIPNCCQKSCARASHSTSNFFFQELFQISVPSHFFLIFNYITCVVEHCYFCIPL